MDARPRCIHRGVPAAYVVPYVRESASGSAGMPKTARISGDTSFPLIARERIDRVEHLPENCKVHVHKNITATAPKIHYGKCLLTMAYVPLAEMAEIYDVCDGFQRGTIFRELDKPFHGKGGCNR